MLLGGVLAGLGGAFFTVGSTGSFNKDMSAGNGFIALAAVIMGRWHPIGATVAALFFGFTTDSCRPSCQLLETRSRGELLRCVAVPRHHHRRGRASSAGSARQPPTASPTSRLT